MKRNLGQVSPKIPDFAGAQSGLRSLINVVATERAVEFLHALASVVKNNWIYIGSLAGGIAVVIGWLLTFLGWRNVRQNNETLEKLKFDQSLRLERAKFIASLNLDKKRNELKFVSDQIQNLYGPLFALDLASAVAYNSYSELFAPKIEAYIEGIPRTPEELQAWRTWMREVMMPLNLNMEKAIIEHGHLIEGDAMPDSFQKFLGHVASYKTVLKKWEEAEEDGTIGTLTEKDHLASSIFPRSFRDDVRQTFEKLRARQVQLLSITGDTAIPAELAHFEAIRENLGND